MLFYKIVLFQVKIFVSALVASFSAFLSAAFMSVLDEHGHIKFHWKPEEKVGSTNDGLSPAVHFILIHRDVSSCSLLP